MRKPCGDAGVHTQGWTSLKVDFAYKELRANSRRGMDDLGRDHSLSAILSVRHGPLCCGHV